MPWKSASGSSSATKVRERKRSVAWHFEKKTSTKLGYMANALSRAMINSQSCAHPSEQREGFGQQVTVPFIQTVAPGVQSSAGTLS